MKKIFLGLLMVPAIAFGMEQETQSVAQLRQEFKTAEARVAQGESFSGLRNAAGLLLAYNIAYPMTSAVSTGAYVTAQNFVPKLVPAIGFLAAPQTYGWLYKPASTLFAAYAGLKTAAYAWNVTNKLIEDTAYTKAVEDTKRLSNKLGEIAHNNGDTGMSYWLK
jgi:hypothetical protein